MLDKYEKAIMTQLLDILETEDLRKAPAGRTVEIDESHAFSIIAKLYGEGIALAWHDDRNDDKMFVHVNAKWEKNWSLVVDIFAAVMRSVVEG